MEIKIGRKYKANSIFVKQYKLANEFIKLISISGNTVTVACENNTHMVRLNFFLENIIDLSKAIESIPRSVEDWKNEHTEMAPQGETLPQPIEEDPKPDDGGILEDEPKVEPEPEPIPEPTPEPDPIPEPESVEPQPEPEPEPTPPEPEPQPEPDPYEEDPWADPYPYGDDNSYPY